MESDVSVYNFTRKCLNCARFAAKKCSKLRLAIGIPHIPSSRLKGYKWIEKNDGKERV